MDWQITPMRETDIDQVLALERIAFHHPWSREALLAELISPRACNYVAKEVNPLENDIIIAYICSQVVIDELSVLRIAVSPAWRARGIGGGLLVKSMATAGKSGAMAAFLEVRPSNQGALALYRKHNFRIIGKRPNYYPETGEEALVMTKQIKER